MNITIPKTGGGDYSLALPTTDNGSEFKAIVPISNYNGGTASTAILTVVGTSEQTSKGVRRVLVKVELPYASVQKCTCDGGQYQVDTANSGESISIHTVLTLPKQAVKDLNAADGTRDAVLERVVMLKGILGVLLNPTKEEVFSSKTYNSVISVDGTIAAGKSDSGTASRAGITVDTADPFVRGAALLKPFQNDMSYDGLNA